jgi:hypothetical protein
VLANESVLFNIESMINVTVPSFARIAARAAVRRMAPLLLILICSAAEAKLKPEPRQTKQAADCVYEAEFTRLEPIRIGGHDVRPVPIGIGTLKVHTVLSSANPICVSQSEFEVLFSTAKTEEGGCRIPSGIHTHYQISLNVLFDGTLAPAGCLTWLHELRATTETKTEDQGRGHEE